MSNIAVIGSGSWGMAIAIHLAKIGNNVKIWSFLQEEADIINNDRKCKFLPGGVSHEHLPGFESQRSTGRYFGQAFLAGVRRIRIHRRLSLGRLLCPRRPGQCGMGRGRPVGDHVRPGGDNLRP